MDFEKFLKSEAKQIDKIIFKELKAWERWVHKTAPSLKVHARTFIKANQGGKKLRGILVKLGYQLGSKGPEKRNSEEIDKIAAAYEIFHTSILAHDDVIDQSPKRRGQPSLYKVLGGGHHGISQAICLGDLGFFLATKIIAQTNFKNEEKVKALEYFSLCTMETSLGEMLDVELPYLDNDKKEKDVMIIMRLKTASYTIAAPLQLGAILARADMELVRKLGVFGENLGIAFQIQDDILGVFGSEEELGKSNQSDLEEGKNTLLIVEALKKASRKQRTALGRHYGQGTQSRRGVEKVRQIFEETGALDNAKKMALKYIILAKKSIPQVTKDTKMSILLNQMAEYLVQRTK